MYLLDLSDIFSKLSFPNSISYDCDNDCADRLPQAAFPAQWDRYASAKPATNNGDDLAPRSPCS